MRFNIKQLSALPLKGAERKHLLYALSNKLEKAKKYMTSLAVDEVIKIEKPSYHINCTVVAFHAFCVFFLPFQGQSGVFRIQFKIKKELAN